MLKRLKWLLRKEEIDFERAKYKGKLAGQGYKYSRSIDGLISTRIIIFSMSSLIGLILGCKPQVENTEKRDYETIWDEDI